MKILFFITGFVFSVSQLMAQAPQANADNFRKLSWLAGHWDRINSKPGSSGYEVWEKNSPQELTGYGITLKGKDTTFAEKFSIVAKDNQLHYVVSVLSDKQEPVSFLITSLTDVDFVCENPNHDFPKKIEYHLKGNQLHASISGDGRSIPFLFERRKN